MEGASLLIINPAFATDAIWEGGVNTSGNPYDNKDDDDVVNGKVPSTSGTYDNINVHVYGTPSSCGRTSEAWVVDYWSDGKKLTVKEGGSVEIVNANKYAGTDNNGAIYAMRNGTINFTNLESVYLASVGGKEEDNDSTAITVKKDSTVNISGGTVQIIGSVDVSPYTSNLKPEYPNAQVTMKLSGKDSFWYGSAIGENENTKNTVNVTLEDGASWIYYNSGSKLSKYLSQGGRKLSNLTLKGGVVILDDTLIDSIYEKTEINTTEKEKNLYGDDGKHFLSEYRTDEGKHFAVNITNLKGAGIFKIDLDWATNKGSKYYTSNSDFINITNSEASTQQLVEFNHDKAHLIDMTVGNKLYFAKVTDGNTSFVTSADGLVENRADEVNDFYYGTESELTDGNTYYFLTKKALNFNNENVTFTKGATQASYLLATEMDTLNKRRGESRYVTGTNNGL